MYISILRSFFMNKCYITTTDRYCKFDFLLYRLFGWKKMLKKITFCQNHINLFTLPLPKKMKERQKKKYFTKLCNYFHRLDIQSVCCSNIMDDLLRYYLKTEFQWIDGSAVFSELFFDVISSFCVKKGYNLEECELIFLSNCPKDVRNYIEKSLKKVKKISIFTTNPSLFDGFVQEFRDQYGIFIQVKGKDDKVKKYNKIYINCEPDRIVDESFFSSVHLIDPYRVYHGAFNEILLSYKTDEDAFIKEHHIIKNLPFTEYYIRSVTLNADKNFVKSFLKKNHYKIVNIKKL